MKVEVVNNTKEPKNYYPYLGIYEETGLIVYFTGLCCGFVIVPDTQWDVGVFWESWLPSQFKRLKGKVILEND